MHKHKCNANYNGLCRLGGTSGQPAAALDSSPAHQQDPGTQGPVTNANGSNYAPNNGDMARDGESVGASQTGRGVMPGGLVSAGYFDQQVGGFD